MQILRSVAELRAAVGGWRAAGERVGLVPTMGALHEGHLSLARLARLHARRVVVTLFVNPKQFDRPDDLAAYPRTEQSDSAALAPLGVDALFAPPVTEMYPVGFATTVSVAGVADELEGAARPGHFAGMATVVTKLLLQALPDVAIFGEKDWQQLQVIRRFVMDLDVPVQILPGPTVREADGLAMSSRNAKLDAAQRRVAPTLHATLRQIAVRLQQGDQADAILEEGCAALLAAGFGRVDYLALRDAETLAANLEPGRPRRLLAAAWLGTTRLIDNISA